MDKREAVVMPLALLLTLSALSGCNRAGSAASPGPLPQSASGYYAVLLNNNQVLYGKLEGLGTPFPILRDVRFVRTTVDQTTKQVSSSLAKRANEPHEPDFMMLNASQIVIVEPVGVNSRIAGVLRDGAPPK